MKYPTSHQYCLVTLQTKHRDLPHVEEFAIVSDVDPVDLMKDIDATVTSLSEPLAIGQGETLDSQQLKGCIHVRKITEGEARVLSLSLLGCHVEESEGKSFGIGVLTSILQAVVANA